VKYTPCLLCSGVVTFPTVLTSLFRVRGLPGRSNQTLCLCSHSLNPRVRCGGMCRRIPFSSAQDCDSEPSVRRERPPSVCTVLCSAASTTFVSSSTCRQRTRLSTVLNKHIFRPSPGALPRIQNYLEHDYLEFLPQAFLTRSSPKGQRDFGQTRLPEAADLLEVNIHSQSVIVWMVLLKSRPGKRTVMFPKLFAYCCVQVISAM